MSFTKIPTGENPPIDLYVIIEIPAFQGQVKYEIDKNKDAILVDRFLPTPMFYPANYGFVNNTLCGDGDPLDVLVFTPSPIVTGSIIFSRPIGMLNMEDESGEDYKIIAVAHNKLTSNYDHIKDINDLPNENKNQIEHFFNNYKGLEKNKWVNVRSWENLQTAKEHIQESIDNYNSKS